MARSHIVPIALSMMTTTLLRSLKTTRAIVTSWTSTVPQERILLKSLTKRLSLVISLTGSLISIRKTIKMIINLVLINQTSKSRIISLEEITPAIRRSRLITNPRRIALTRGSPHTPDLINMTPSQSPNMIQGIPQAADGPLSMDEEDTSRLMTKGIPLDLSGPADLVDGRMSISHLMTRSVPSNVDRAESREPFIWIAISMM